MNDQAMMQYLTNAENTWLYWMSDFARSYHISKHMNQLQNQQQNQNHNRGTSTNAATKPASHNRGVPTTATATKPMKHFNAAQNRPNFVPIKLNCAMPMQPQFFHQGHSTNAKIGFSESSTSTSYRHKNNFLKNRS